MTRLLFPLWQPDERAYRAICAYLGITPRSSLYDRLAEYLANAPFRFTRPYGFSLFLARRRLTRFRIARLDIVTKLFLPDHPVRHVLNGVIALHECDGEGFREMAASPVGWRALVSMLGWALRFGLSVAVTIPWLACQFLLYVAGIPFRSKARVAGMRVLVTGVNRGLGLDLMLHCLEQGAEVIGTVRNRQSLEALEARLPVEAPAKLLITDLSQPGAFVHALREAKIQPESLAMSILSASVKHGGESEVSLNRLRDTFQVNCFAAAEFAAWLYAPGSAFIEGRSSEVSGALDLNPSPVTSGKRENRKAPMARALVLISSMGRWHGMPFACGYNASKAALSIWGESLDMELRQSQSQRFTVTIVEPGMFESGMTQQTPMTRYLFASRREVARRILAGALAGRRVIRPPFWFALLTWGVCLAGRDIRFRLFARTNPRRNQ